MSPVLKSRFKQYVPKHLQRLLKQKKTEWSARQRSRRCKQLINDHGTFSARDLGDFCRNLELRPNGILLVQCSYNDLYTYSGTPYQFLATLTDFVGDLGTLLMPAYSTNMQDLPCRPFDVRREPVTTGIIAELFRREEGVIRSLHPRHSLCAKGPMADELLSGHEDCIYADGPHSPFERMRELDAQALCLGTPPGFNSFVHWTEDIDPDHYPIRAHDGPYDCRIRNYEGVELIRPFFRRSLGQRNRISDVGKQLTAASMRRHTFHGVQIYTYSLACFATELLQLRDRGIVAFR